MSETLVEEPDDNRCPQTGCIYHKGHPADGKTVFSFHVAYEPKTGRRISWTDDNPNPKRSRPRRKADAEQSFRFPKESGEVYRCESVHVEARQCEKVREHDGNHIAHRPDQSLVVWA